jgi:CheY-like chemotaxis protein
MIRSGADEEGGAEWRKSCEEGEAGNVETKTIEVVAPRSSLTPCILDDDPEQLTLLSEMISEMGYELLPTADSEEAIRLVHSGICADVQRPGIHAYEFLDRLLRVDSRVRVIIITKEYTLESALEAIRRGATDSLPKPLDRLRLKRALDDVASPYDQRRRVRALEEQLLRDLEFHGIVGKSPVMLEVFDFARKVARHYTNVLLVSADGHRQRTGGPGHPTAEFGEPAAPRGFQLFGDGGHLAGQPTVWPRVRGLYRRDGNAAGIVRIRGRRNGFPG